MQVAIKDPNMEKRYQSFERRFQDAILATNLAQNAGELEDDGGNGVDAEAGGNDMGPDFGGGDGGASEEDEIEDVGESVRKKQPKGKGKGKGAGKQKEKGKGKGKGGSKRKETAAVSASDDAADKTKTRQTRKSPAQTLLPTVAADSTLGSALEECM